MTLRQMLIAGCASVWILAAILAVGSVARIALIQ